MDTEHIVGIVECSCYSDEHLLLLHWFSDDKDEMYVSVHLKELSFWKRIKLAIKYIFGYKSKFGHFESFVWDREQVCKLERNIDKFLYKGELR